MLVYPALTVLAVIVTANHFWLDGMASAALLALALPLQRAGRAALPRLAAAGRIPGLARSPAAQPAVQPVVLPAPARPRRAPFAPAAAAMNGQPVNGERINGRVPFRQVPNGGLAETRPDTVVPERHDGGFQDEH
jgi:hypothetical protein